jgi:DNA-binding GntR family transcriptional regulator
MQNLPSLKVHRRSLDRRAADVLREEILSGRFPPGFRLVETWLAQQLHVSRGTVRAALAELAHEGLVDQVAYTKWSVPDLKAQDAWELYTLRACLEGLASNLAADAMTAEGSTLLSDSFARLVAAANAGKVGPAVEADLAFHKTIVALAGHSRLSRQYEILEQQVRRYMTSSNALMHDTREIGDQHRPLFEAILAGESAEAEALAKAHNMTEGRKLFDRLTEMEKSEVVSLLPVRGPRRLTPAVHRELSSGRTSKA